MSLEIFCASGSPDRVEQVRALFAEYAASLEFDLSFQDFERECADLPGEYAPPSGRLLLAMHGSEPAGCIALRRIDSEICEMKRLFVRSAFRGMRIGRLLCVALIQQARDAGYRRMRLDTVPSMREAIGLYEALGFRPIEAYRFNPVEGAMYMELELG